MVTPVCVTGNLCCLGWHEPFTVPPASNHTRMTSSPPPTTEMAHSHTRHSTLPFTHPWTNQGLANPHFRPLPVSGKKVATSMSVTGYLCYLARHEPMTVPPASNHLVMTSSPPSQHRNGSLSPRQHCFSHTLGPTNDLPNPHICSQLVSGKTSGYPSVCN